MISFSHKILLGLIAVSCTTVSVQLIPMSRQASIWNRCLIKTSSSLRQVKAVQNIDDQSREVLSVMICNGAVFEPKFKTNIK
tara:strand:+ start:1460 stop:1705 length:246 start_codon:yes stop_codon:yes gene_type:complete